jgi:hypothetical protein
MVALRSSLDSEPCQSQHAYLRLALLQDWMCEAAESRQDQKLIKQAAESGVAAAEAAVKLNPTPSEAHQWVGGLGVAT